MNLIIDETDLKILKIFDKLVNGNENITTWHIAKKLFPKIKGKILIDKSNFVNYRLDRMICCGIIEKKKNGKKYDYYLDSDRVLFKKHKFPDGYRDSILLKTGNKWSAWEL